MRSYNNLFNKIIAFPNLLLAAGLAQKAKRFHYDVAKFNFNIECNLLKIQEELFSGEWIPGDYHRFTIYEPKKRQIVAAPYRDRVVHHALCNIIEPLFDRGFIEHSYACRKGKGTHIAIDKAQDFLSRSKFILQCDVKKFFPSIDHEMLYKIISKKICCAKTLDLIQKIIASGGEKGLPIGNLTSQLFANLYLNELDYFIKQQMKVKKYVRYMDDFLVFGDDKQYLWKVKNEINNFLTVYLNLQIHENKTFVFPVSNGVDFLGFRIFKNYRRLKRSNVLAFIKRFKIMRKLWKEGLLDFEKMSESICAWIAHAEHANTWKLRTKVLANVRL